VTVPFLDLGAAYEELAPELDAAYRTVMGSGRFLFGDQLEAFESEYSAHVDARACAGVGSGFDALSLSLRALGVGPGDEVIVPTHTSVVTWLAVAAVGAIPVGVEPAEATHTLDPERLEAARGGHTRAVVPVHLYGRPAAMGPILDWAREHDLVVLSDAAQAHGATIEGQGVGGLGDAVAWSFYPSKNLGAFADAGCVTAADEATIEEVRKLRNYGMHEGRAAAAGVNSRLDELQAAFLRVRLRHLDEWNARRLRTAQRYLDELARLPLELPRADDDVAVSAWHQFVVCLPNRERVREALAERGVETMVHYPTPPFAHPALAPFAPPHGTFARAERLADEVLSLPVGPHLVPDGVERTVGALAAVLD
jgi:dTDP-3-amino-3,4,6-trideoxy-alpha-D-glucose transaminase